MEDPPPSQASDTVPQIFRNADGSQWRVFVEAGGIIGRPKLIRTLKKAGAIVCSDPKQAQVILVDSKSDQGRLFIRDWGKDTDKVVLEHSWVTNSVAAGHVLDQDKNNWGGCLTVDDGLPIMNEELDNVLKSPLPTPRITPVEVATSEPTGPVQPVVPMPVNVPPDLMQQPVQNAVQNPMLHLSDSDVLPQNQPPPLLPQPLPTYVSEQQAMMPPFPQPQHANNMPGFPFTPGSNNIPPRAMLNFLSQCYSMPQGMFQWNAATGHNFGPPFFNQQMLNPMHSGQYSQDFHSLPPTANLNYSHNPSYTSPIISTDSSLSPSGIPPSLRRKSPVMSRSTPTSSYTSNGNMRSASPANYVPSRSSQSATRPTLGPALSSTLFTSRTGEELSFFVQVDLNNRSKVVTAIKRNGGKISTNHTTADFAILYSRSKTFDHLLQSTLAAGRPAINASFVFDSVEQNKILDTSPYEFESPKTTPRGKRKRGKSIDDEREDKAEKKRLEKNRRQAERRQQLKIKEESSPLKKPKAPSKDVSWPSSEVTTNALPGPCQISSDDAPRPRSPTPPAEHTRVRRGTGEGFMFSDHERDYVRRYVPMLFERDHRMSMTGVAHTLSKKMDNHSLNSWRSFLGGPSFGAEFEMMRKRASIAYRKAEGQRDAMEVKENNEAGLLRNTGISPPPASRLSAVGSDAQRTKLREEIEIVANFFATGGGKENQDEEDAVLWARLTEQVQCQTAETWELFYGDHHEAVSERYNQLVDASTGETSSAVAD